MEWPYRVRRDFSQRNPFLQASVAVIRRCHSLTITLLVKLQNDPTPNATGDKPAGPAVRRRLGRRPQLRS